MDVLIERTLPHNPKDVFRLFMDLKNYPTFIPEIAAVHIITTASQGVLQVMKTESWVEAKNLSLKVRSTVEANPKILHIDIFYMLGPLRVAHAEVDFTDSGEGTTVRLHVVAKLVPQGIRAKIIGRLDEMTDRYTAIFEKRCRLKLAPYSAA